MLRYVVGLMLCFGLLVVGPGTGMASVEKRVLRDISVPETPVDSVSSGNGTRFFVLTSTGKVFIYGKNGDFKDILEVDGKPDFISSSADGEILYLTDKDTGAVQILNVNFVQEINIEGSAVRGDINGSVVIALFSDFQ